MFVFVKPFHARHVWGSEMSNPKPGHPIGGAGRSGADTAGPGWAGLGGGEARRIGEEWAGRGGSEANQRRHLSWTTPCKNEEGKSYVNKINYHSGRLTTGLTGGRRAVYSWDNGRSSFLAVDLWTDVFCLSLQTFFMQGISGNVNRIKEHARRWTSC